MDGWMDLLYVSFTAPLVPYTIFKQNQYSVIHNVGLYCTDKALSVYAMNEYKGKSFNCSHSYLWC